MVFLGIVLWGGVPKKETNIITRQNGSADTGVNAAEGGKRETPVVTSGAIEESVDPEVTTTATPVPTKEPKITKMYFKKKTVQLWQREKVYNPPVIMEKGAAYQKISWSVSHKEYATVNQKGEVTLKNKGAGKKIKVTATIHYMEKGVAKTLSAGYMLYGKQQVKKITISVDKDYILVGKKYRLTAVCAPKDATLKAVTWSSSNKKYATISKKGVIQAKSAGAGKVVTFTAKSVDGFQAKKTITFRILDKKKPMIALTFDDGPNVPHTTRIVNQLKAYHARATFFCVGTQLQTKGAKKLVAQSSKYGNEIASHTFHHKNLAVISATDIQKESVETNNLIHAFTGKYPLLTRPPYGSVSEAVKNTITTPLILWSVDTMDWKTRNSNTTIAKVLKEVRDGDIILMHDYYEATAVAAEALIPQLIQKGYQLVTVSELADLKNVKLTRGNTYFSMR